jgi:predicted RecB family nuclease
MTINLYTPTLFKSYLNCKYIIFNELNAEKLGIKKKEITKSNRRLFEKGDKFEEDYFNHLKKEYSKIIDIKDHQSLKEDREKKTIECMQEGYEVIRGGYFYDDKKKWNGESDFLIINKNVKSKLGNYSYEVFDTKNSTRVKTEHIFQITIYEHLLRKIQGIQNKNFYVVLKQMKKEAVRLDRVIDFVEMHKKKYENFVENEIDNAKPEKCSHCKQCDWQNVCKNIWKKNDSLDLMPDLRKDTRKTFQKLGIDTVQKLSEQDENKEFKDITAGTSKKFIIFAKLRKKEEKSGKPEFLPIQDDPSLVKGLRLLPKPSVCDLYFDIESVKDHVVEGGLQYLFGIYYQEDGKKKYKKFWSHNHEEEKNNLIKLFDFFESHLEKYPDSFIYHYASYELTALSGLTSKYGEKSDEFVKFKNLQKFVDLFTITKQTIYASDGYSIKDLEKYYNFVRTADVKDGEESEEFYIDYLETRNQKYLDQIEKYNEEDVISTFELHQWLLKQRNKDIPWFKPEIEKLDLREREKKMNYNKELLINSNLKDKDFVKTIFDLLGFYYRANKPKWQRYFDRKYLIHEELVEDVECLANMRRIGEITRHKESNVYTYEYDEQDTKIDVGDTVHIANNLLFGHMDYAGVVIDHDIQHRVIKIAKGTRKSKEPLPSILSIGPSDPLNIKYLEECAYRFVDNLVSNKNTCKALKSILKKETPKIKGIKEGEKIIKTKNFEIEIPKIISELDQSYIYLQGAPGTGKTRIGAITIVELLKQGKKVGITGNSHKVIHNLLDRVIHFAKEAKFVFRGIKKHDELREETIYHHPWINSTKDGKDFKIHYKNEEAFLFAGTKYLFCMDYNDDQLDYLFIDEASQFSLADIISVGQSAKNIVLIGDQNQLGHPTEGSHPGESAKSILNYLLGDLEVIPDEKGIFLNITHRMHPNINSFVSNNFYEGKLVCHEDNAKRSINLSKGTIIPNEGLFYIEANHEGDSQKSVTEANIVKDLLDQFTGRDFYSEKGEKKLISKEDILVVSPYNIQTNFLTSKFKKLAKMGTIDKFQGQQGSITIVSMTSSDPECLPRNLDFLFDKNRLNVSISRSQLISIIIFNPKLLDVYPRSINQLILLNNFCKILKYKIN